MREEFSCTDHDWLQEVKEARTKADTGDFSGYGLGWSVISCTVNEDTLSIWEISHAMSRGKIVFIIIEVTLLLRRGGHTAGFYITFNYFSYSIILKVIYFACYVELYWEGQRFRDKK